MKIIIMALLAMLGHAEDQTPWQKLHAHLLQTENYYPDYNIFLLENIVPGKDVDHQADYFRTAKVIVNSDNSLTPVGVKAISETWKLNSEGNWDIDQWKHVADDNGTLLSLEHDHIVETTDSIVLVYESVPEKSVSDPGELAVWQSILDRWYIWNQR